MFVEISDIDKVPTVKKPWGYEKWIADGEPNFKYVLKEIFFRAPYRTSIQFHKFKSETNYVKSGKGFLYYSSEPISIKKFENGGYSKKELDEKIKGLNKQELLPGMVIHIKYGCIHRIEAVEDLLIMEASTTELDDVVRLQDDSGRPDGRIESEHSD